MKAGKLPLDLLGELLAQVRTSDPRVVLGPTPGEDAALIDFGDRYLVAKTDPVTFVTDQIGRYLVQVNANDVAVMGATPRWLMATLLLPEGTSAETARGIFSQLTDACAELGISLAGATLRSLMISAGRWPSARCWARWPRTGWCSLRAPCRATRSS